MSEQRKRLTDAEIAESRRLVKEAPERPILAEVALEMDHDQAREDRKWLVGQLRRTLCVDPKCSCAEDRARLAEMDPQ